MCGVAVVTGDVISRVGARDGDESSERECKLRMDLCKPARLGS